MVEPRREAHFKRVPRMYQDQKAGNEASELPLTRQNSSAHATISSRTSVGSPSMVLESPTGTTLVSGSGSFSFFFRGALGIFGGATSIEARE